MPREEGRRDEPKERKLIFVHYKALLDTFSSQPISFTFSSVRGTCRCSQISHLFIMVTRQLQAACTHHELIMIYYASYLLISGMVDAY